MPTENQRLNREQKNELRKQQLLDAAWTLFCELGYEAVTIDAVAKAAGCSRMPVYTMFGDKQVLFFELWRRDAQAVTDLLLDHAPPGRLLRDNLSDIADLVAKQLRSNTTHHGEQLWFVTQTIALSRPELAARIEEGARRVISDMAMIVSESKLEDSESLRTEPEVIAAHLAAHINGLTSVQFQTGTQYADADTLRDIFLTIAFK